MSRIQSIIFSMVYALLFSLPQVTHCKIPHISKSNIVVHPLHLEESSKRPAYATVRDSKGFLWIASSNYLLRYDGYTLKEYQIHPENEGTPGDERLNALLLDPDGSIWIGSTKLIQFYPQTETFDTYDVYTTNYPIEAIRRDYKGVLWLGGRGFDLVGFDPKKKEVIHRVSLSTLDYQQAHTITSIAASHSKKQLWITSGSGVYFFDTESLALDSYPIPQSLQLGHKLTRDIIVDKNNNVWVASIEGVVRINPETRKYKQYTYDPYDPKSLSSNDTWSIFEDSKGQIWVGTDKKGVNKYQEETDDFLRIPSSTINSSLFPSSTVLDIYEDSQGSLWFSAGLLGVRRITEHLEKFISIKNNPEDANSLSFNNTLEMIEDNKGDIWIATDGGGLNRYNPTLNQFKRYAFDPNKVSSISSDSVISLAEDRNGIIWIGLWAGGVNRFEPKTERFTHIKKQAGIPLGEGLMNDNIFLTYVDESGLLWINPLGEGLQIYNPQDGSFQTFTPKKVNSGLTSVNTSIYKILPAGNDNYWVGGAIGLELFNKKEGRFTRILKDEIGGVYDILQEGDIIWVATASKFIRYDINKKSMMAYTTSNGLIHNNVTSIERDSNGYFWLGTRGGLSRFDPKTETFFNFDKSDGLPGTQFNPLSHLATRNGMMYFGSTEGIAVFDPMDIPLNKTMPNLALTNIEITRNSGKTTRKFHPKQHIDFSETLVLPYSDRNITFEFSALNLIAPESNQYQYKLTGLDKSWVVVESSKRSANYTNLPPGNYTFQVIGSNNDDLWNHEGTSVDLVILPPWWLTWWAITIFTFSFSFLIYLTIRWRTRHNEHRKKILELLIKEKTANLELNRKLNRRISTMLENERKSIAHEVHDNINSTIIATRMIAQNIERLSQAKVVNANKITQLAKTVDQHLSETYDFFRALVRKLRPEIIETLGFDGAMAELIENYNSMHDSYCFYFELKGDKKEVKEDVGIELYRIAQEAITNAIKHAFATKITLIVSYTEDGLCVSIIDNGKGFLASSTPGLGVAHMRERALSINGQLSINRVIDTDLQDNTLKGTAVTVCIPLP